ncbi:putative leucine-rich repeat-containing protein DDB_G0290503 [Amyelois transitella]|uniref:putative leucine-rich repeat-containing protein DDB_G0290503 n=1 Tax=Amyelois transitella TaxID=680683 RepID=UPI00067BB3C0|nr:putative leucine-rich repeat-containing protein DDB_G0290503 [Amyelois transitella]
MADSFFGFDTSLSNLNDDEGGGEPSEDEYDALNDETFGQDSEAFDWEVEHETLAQQLESNRRFNSSGIDETANTQLEASLSKLVLDETDSPQSRSFGSSVWRHDLSFPMAPTPVPPLKNVCTVEELERQLRQKQMSSQQQQQQMPFSTQNYFQPRFPVILQRPPGLQAPVPLPFAPQNMTHNMSQMSQPLNKILGQNNQMTMNHLGSNVNQLGQNQNQLGQNVNQFMQNANQMVGQFQNNQLSQTNLLSQLTQNIHMNQSNQMLQNHLSQNQNQLQSMTQMGQNVNQIGQNVNHMGQNLAQMGQSGNHMGASGNHMGQSGNQMGPSGNHMGQSGNQMGPSGNHMGQSGNQMGKSGNQMGQSVNHMGQNVNQMGQSGNQMGQNMNQIGQNVNQMGQNVNQMMPNGNQFPGMNQFPRAMGQPRMMAPPPGINMPRQNFSPNVSQYNPNFRGPSVQQKSNPDPTQPQAINVQPKTQSPTKSLQKSNQKQQMNAKSEKTVQKSRVYNNTKIQNSNMTSQNLVQLIQNTHPMLQQYNNSYHNASHHPMLNRNNMFGNSLNQFAYNPRQNGVFNSNNRHMNGDDSSATSDDEYAGLMTQREKQWLLNIQMLQLNTGTPYIHDFYYTVFLERQASKEKEGIKEAHKANQQNHPFYSGGVKQESHTRERHNSVRHNSTSEDSAPRTYVPTQFENSLGKLQCGSVTAPRKIIDVELVGERGSRPASRASTANPAEVPREMKRTKQLLLDIEALYLILLRLEELNDPLAISNALILKEREEKQKQLEAAQKEAEDEDETNVFLRNIESVQRRPKPETKTEIGDKRQVVNLAVNQKPPAKNLLDEDKDELINKMFAGLMHGDRLAQMLTVRKGRVLISRFVSRVAGSHARTRGVWARVLRSVSAAARRDDGTLAALAPHFALYIQSTTGWSAVLESCSLLAEALDPARTPYALTSAFTLSCVCALIEKAAILVNTPEATSNERQWSKFLKTLARALKNTTLTVARPLKPLPENKILHHLRQLDSRTTIEILQRGKTAIDFADLSKTDVTEQLVKHLC